MAAYNNDRIPLSDNEKTVESFMMENPEQQDDLKAAPGETAETYSEWQGDSKAAADELGDKDGPWEKFVRLCRQNKLAVISGIVILVILVLVILAPAVAPFGEAEQDRESILQGPSLRHLFGTDRLGRDIFTRLLYGGRVSLMVGIIPTALSLTIGIIFGLLSGYYGGWIDYVIMRFADIMLAFPSLLLAMVIMYTLGNTVFDIFIALAMVGWASVARVVRSQTLSLKETEYVQAARSIGVSSLVIMFRHILPNCIPSLIVLFTLNVPSAILSESTLSFLGIGVQPPSASWGLMVNEARQLMFRFPWLALAPCLAIMTIVLAFNFLGDGLRDVLDPYLKTK